jgi:UDP-2,3-diacylglucosamine pyrophosphatase LpxH
MARNLGVTDDEIIEAVKVHVTQRAAAAALGMSKRNIERRLQLLARKGWSPKHDMRHPVPDGFRVKGVSTLYRPDGSVSAQWVKSAEDAQRQREMLEAACLAMVQDLPKLAPRKARERGYREDLLTAYPIGDPHIGMRSWAAETGQDWDLSIAERVHCGAMAALVDAAPASEQALIVNLGDMLHYDSMAPVTPRSGHLLDADGRYAKVVSVAVKVMRQCIESALEKHQRVRVINAPGNHDETGALWMSIALAHIYENEPRVSVDTCPAVFTYFRWGRCLIGVHHGHTCKPAALPGVMAADRAADWGETTHRYWWMGHVHHESKREYPGVSVESFNTLASRDAYAAAGGWRSHESMQAIVLHREHGEVARSRVSAAMFREAA